MPLVLGIVILAFAVFLGGLAALFPEPARWAMSAIRTFAVVAAASIAVLHLLPEAISEVGAGALVVTFIGAVGPVFLERAVPSRLPHDAPTTALAMGYAAVIAHQAGEGAALASLAETGALSLGIVLAVAAHTVPLAMVVGIRVLEARDEDRRLSHRSHAGAISLALAGVAAATAVGAAAGSMFGARLAAVQPWVLAAVAGLLLHALSHDALASPPASARARVADMMAGWGGLALATVGVEKGGVIDQVPAPLRAGALVLLASLIAARSFHPRAHRHAHSEPRA